VALALALALALASRGCPDRFRARVVPALVLVRVSLGGLPWAIFPINSGGLQANL
jgi:hypothetical protein